jgi:D-alanyl-D-alanine carboxypeptidase/D-alanyl-D-alanine-endopeptidase (penicillin-binding protein 4)
VVRRLTSARRTTLVLATALGIGLGWPDAHPQASASPPASDPATAQPTDQPTDQPLAARIDAAIEAAKLGEAKLGISIVDLETGAVLYEHEAGTPLNPASNVKLITSAAALARLGPEHRYTTQVWIDKAGLTDGSVGKLYLQGGGDPALVTGEIYELAGQLEAAGVRKIKGPIVVDIGRYADEGLPPGFEQKDEFASHRAPGGAMSVNYNTFEVFARPAEVVGESPTLAAQPNVPSLVLVSEAKTVAGNRNKLWVSSEQQDGKLIVTFHGEVGVSNGRSSYRYPIHDPSRYAGELLALALAQRGIEIDPAKVKVERGEVPKGAQLLGTTRSETLSELCRAVNKWSNNFIAEQLLRSLAPDRGATAEAALEQLRAYTREIGMPQDGLVIGNGSGLYANNLVSAKALTHLLGHVYADFRYRSDFLASLAIMGTDGTTRERLQDSRARGFVRVKTGTLDDVSALSGYAGTTGRDPIAFSILLNGLDRKQRGRARALQDEIAELLAVHVATLGQR